MTEPLNISDDGIRQDLRALAEAGEPIIAEARIYRPSDRTYLSGYPHIWTQFGERAFAFKDAEQASVFIQDHPSLKGCEVRGG
jgi:hypothetical protein